MQRSSREEFPIGKVRVRRTIILFFLFFILFFLFFKNINKSITQMEWQSQATPSR